jgi:hypothetical protein
LATAFALALPAARVLTPAMLPLLVVLVVLGIVAGIIWLAWTQVKQARANLQALAGRLGLAYLPEPAWGGAGQVTGQLDGRAVRFWNYTTGSGKSRQTWCAVGVRPRQDGGLSIELQRQNFGTKVMTWFGAKEIQVGDPAFDAAWFVQTNQPEFLAAALVPEIREKFMTQPALAWEGGYKLAEGEVRFAVRGTFAQAKLVTDLEARLPLLRDLADVAEVFAAERR